MSEPAARRGWIVTAASTGVALVLGLLYAWSVLKSGIPESWGWSHADKALPYSVACLAFALSMVPAGRLQDRIGPRAVTALGGLLTGLGCIVAGLAAPSLFGFVFGFGVLTGAGIGFGYAAITPAALKWFPPQRTGLIAGIVVAGAALSSVYIAPLSAFLLGTFARDGESGLPATLLSFGIGTAILVSLLALWVRNPEQSKATAAKATSANDVAWPAMLRRRRFWLLWAMYFFAAAAGLTFISVAADLGKRALGTQAFYAVVVLALGNGGGRVLAGHVSDRLGRPNTLLVAFLGQIATVAALFGLVRAESQSAPAILVVLALLGLNYGANLALFPAASKDAFGLRQFGVNYGFLFTAWGAAGLVMPWVNGRIQDAGLPGLSFAILLAMLALGAALTRAIPRAQPAA